MRAIARIFVSFCSLLLAIAIFTVWLGPVSAWPFIFKFTMFFALPVWLIDLPLLFLLKNVDRRRLWIIPALGALIGPLCLLLWCGILVLRGNDWLSLWSGDPEAFGLGAMLFFASLIGLATNSFYTVALILRKRLAVRSVPANDAQSTNPNSPL